MSKLCPNQPTVSVSEANKFQTVVISVAPLFELKWIFISNAIISLSWHYVNTLLNWWKFVRYDLLGTNFKNIIPPLCYEPTERILSAQTTLLKFGHSEKGTQFEKTFHIEFDATEQHQILSGRFFQILCPSQNVQTLRRCPLRTQTVSILNLTWYPLATLASQKDLPIGVFQQSTVGTLWLIIYSIRIIFYLYASYVYCTVYNDIANINRKNIH